MKSNLFKSLFFTFILISLSLRSYMTLITTFSVEVDEVTYASHIQDGDTFQTSAGDWIRLADVDTPERGDMGYYEATNVLSNLINNKKVYLDIDDLYRYDTYGSRLVCLVYVNYNSTHYLNVNEALLLSNRARIDDYPNEFSPYEWSLYTPKLVPGDRTKLLGVSVGFGFIVTLIIYLVSIRVWNYLSSLSTRRDRDDPWNQG